MDSSFLLAYIDAGSGSLIIQAIIATVVAVPFFFRQQLAKLTRSFRGSDRAAVATTADDGDRDEATHR